MARQPRQKSESGIYHVMLKGIDGRNIFLHEGDRKKFIDQVLQAKEKDDFSLLAYCLMDNHVHLLLEEEELGATIKRIAVGYVLWHNNQYGRSGHLFQNRYLSEAVETDEYLMTVARYIHQNPVKAGMVDKAISYTWSSYYQYIDAYNGKVTDINPERVMVYFKARNDFEAFMNMQKEDKCLGYKVERKNTDDELTEIIEKKYQVQLGQQLTKEKLKSLIRELYSNEQTNIRQLARVFGLNKSMVERMIKK